MMEVTKHYKRSPITEAIVDFKVTLPEGTSIDLLAEIHTHIIDTFPTFEPIVASSFMIQIGASIQSNQLNHGYLFRSEDGKRIFQAKLDGFTYNRLRPYESWESFRNEARQLWNIYRDVCKPVNVTRSAIRYINRIELPGPYVDFKDYLRTGPEIAPGLPQRLSGFFIQLQIPQDDLACNLVLNETLAPDPDPTVVAVILDFDLFREEIWPSDSEEIWDFLEKLRVRKNELFESSITEKTKELFN